VGSSDCFSIEPWRVIEEGKEQKRYLSIGASHYFELGSCSTIFRRTEKERPNHSGLGPRTTAARCWFRSRGASLDAAFGVVGCFSQVHQFVNDR
jgi:hypothetical protein